MLSAGNPEFILEKIVGLKRAKHRIGEKQSKLGKLTKIELKTAPIIALYGCLVMNFLTRHKETWNKEKYTKNPMESYFIAEVAKHRN